MRGQTQDNMALGCSAAFNIQGRKKRRDNEPM